MRLCSNERRASRKELSPEPCLARVGIAGAVAPNAVEDGRFVRCLVCDGLNYVVSKLARTKR
jgi:hypothetical protein